MIYLLLKIFVSSNEALILYYTHKITPFVQSLKDCTLLQKQFLFSMAAEDINYNESIETYLVGIAKGVGIEFRGSNSSRRHSNSFREQMKAKQRRNKERLK